MAEIVNAKQLRAKLGYYLDRLECGHEVTIIRNSHVIGRMVPEHPAESTEVSPVYQLEDGRTVTFRRFGEYEDPEPLKRLHREALESTGALVDTDSSEGRLLDRDLDAVAATYDGWNGEFWVGQLPDQELVAMGGFKLFIDVTSDETDETIETNEADETNETDDTNETYETDVMDVRDEINDSIKGAAELKRMRVRPDLQGQGLGGHLLDLLETKARARNYKSLVLDVTDKQLMASQLYEKQGFYAIRR